MRYFLLISALSCGLGGIVAQPSWAFNQEDLMKLLTTNKCYKCDLRDVNLQGKLLSSKNSEPIDIVKADLTNAKLHGLRLPKSDAWETILINSDLSGTDLSKGIFTEANFSDANLSNANLKHLSARGADFSGANLSGANLTKAKLNNSSFQGANLSGANLTKARLEGANLQNVNLDGAILDRTELWNANLNGVNKEKVDMSKVIYDRVLRFDSEK